MSGRVDEGEGVGDRDLVSRPLLRRRLRECGQRSGVDLSLVDEADGERRDFTSRDGSVSGPPYDIPAPAQDFVDDSDIPF